MTKRATIGSCRCSQDQTIRMGEIVPRSEESKPPMPSSAGRKSWPWALVGAAFLLGLIFFLQHRSESQAREKARQESESPAIKSEDASMKVRFTRDDIEIKRHWTPLAGRHPVVKIRCTIDSTAPPCRRAVLCYRSVGADEWGTAETLINRKRTVRITLRDLYRDMPYECFFVIVGRDTMFQSEVVRFET